MRFNLNTIFYMQYRSEEISPFNARHFFYIAARLRHLIFVRSFGETQDIVSKAGKELTKREIVLVDQSAAEVLIKSFMASPFLSWIILSE